MCVAGGFGVGSGVRTQALVYWLDRNGPLSCQVALVLDSVLWKHPNQREQGPTEIAGDATDTRESGSTTAELCVTRTVQSRDRSERSPNGSGLSTVVQGAMGAQRTQHFSLQRMHNGHRSGYASWPVTRHYHAPMHTGFAHAPLDHNRYLQTSGHPTQPLVTANPFSRLQPIMILPTFQCATSSMHPPTTPPPLEKALHTRYRQYAPTSHAHHDTPCTI